MFFIVENGSLDYYNSISGSSNNFSVNRTEKKTKQKTHHWSKDLMI